MCRLGLEGLPFGLDCGLHANPVEVNGTSQTRGIRPLSATRSVSPLLWIRGVQPYPHRKGICVAVDKASVFAMHQRRKLDCCVSALGSYFLLSHFVSAVMPAPRGLRVLTGRRVGDGPPAAPLAWGTSSGSVGGGPSEMPGRSTVRVFIDHSRSDGSTQGPGCPNGTHRRTGMSASHLVG